jgi:hypothetical protein
MELKVPLAGLQRLLFVNWAVIVAASYTVELLRHGLKIDNPGRWYAMLSLSYERNVPTWYSACVLLLCAAVLGCIACQQRRVPGRPVFPWALLAVCFTYISLDESASFHERLNAPMSDRFGLGGVFFYGWIIPAMGVLLVLGLVLFKFVWQLPRLTRRRFILAGVLYVGGAMGVEMPLGYYVHLTDKDDDLIYALIDGVEESMELLGSTLFLLALLKHVKAENAPGEVISATATGR